MLKIDVTKQKWESPVIAQYKVRSLPQLVAYDGKKLLSTDKGRVMGFLGERAKSQGASSSSGPAPQPVKKRTKRRSGPGGHVATISNGQEVQFLNRLSPNKLTVVVFTNPTHASWQKAKVGLTKLVKGTPNTQLLIININNPTDPVALQYRVNMKEVPKYILYKGKQVVARDARTIDRTLRAAYVKANGG